MSRDDEHLEVERTYVVADGWSLPDLSRLPGVTRVGAPEEVALDALYFDTADLRLLGAGTTLRRRTGGHDEGWHLKLPVGPGSTDRLEVRHALGTDDASVPDELAALTRARRRDRPLVPVVHLANHRVRRVLSGPDGDLAEVTDDHVTARRTHGDEDQQEMRWREVEVELAGGSRPVLDVVERELLAAGAQPSPWPSKLGRALAGTGPTSQEAPVDGGSAAGDVVLGYVRHQVEQLTVRDPAVRRGEPDAIHKMRVATRRLRSALATHRPLLDQARTEPVRGGLAWLAGVLGAARDAEVLRSRLHALVTSEPSELLLGPVARRLDDELSTAEQAARADVLEVLDGERYQRLLTDLDALLEDPALSDRGRRPAREVLPPRVAKDWRRARRRLENALADGGALPLHEARKAVKRARYAAEGVEAVSGKDAVRFAARLERVQEVLGEYNDAVTAQELLRRLGVEAHLAGENGFSFGRLHCLEQGRAQAALDALPAAWRKASARKRRRWLR